MTFDVSPGSKSVHVLNKYLASHGKAPVTFPPDHAARLTALKKTRAGNRGAAKAVRQKWEDRATKAGFEPRLVNDLMNRGQTLVHRTPGMTDLDVLEAGYQWAMNEAGRRRSDLRRRSKDWDGLDGWYGVYSSRTFLDHEAVRREALRLLEGGDSSVFYNPDDRAAVRLAWQRAQDAVGAKTHGAVKYQQLLEGMNL